MLPNTPSAYVVLLPLTALLFGGCAMTPIAAVSYVPPPIGASWTQSITSTGSFGSGTSTNVFTRGERIWDGKSRISFDSKAGSILLNEQYSTVAFVAGDKPVLSWEPPHGWDWPLIAGKMWAHSHNFHNHTKGSIDPYVATDTIEEYEEVTVPAGTFKTFRIRSVEDNGYHSVTWFSPELGIAVKQSRARSQASPNGPGTMDMEIVSQTIRK